MAINQTKRPANKNLSQHKKQEAAREAVRKAEVRVLLLARRWAAYVADMNPEVVAAPTHHLLRAIAKLDSLSLT